MNKIIKNLLPVFFILINTINVSTMINEIEIVKNIDHNNLLTCINTNNIQKFIKILATENNFELTNISGPSLFEKIINIEDTEKNKINFIHILYKYSMLSEVVQQVKVGTRIRRFHKIYKRLEMYLERNIPIYPPLIERILSSGREPENPTSFYWYISEFVIGNNNILNPCFEQSLQWFVNTTINSIFEGDAATVIKNLEMVPFIIKMKYGSLNLIDEITELLREEELDNIIAKIEKQLQRPSRCTAFLRYSMFT